MYTLIQDEAAVVRDSDGVVIAPCQSVDEPAFVAYQAWVAAGNEPTVLTTRSAPAEEEAGG